MWFVHAQRQMFFNWTLSRGKNGVLSYEVVFSGLIHMVRKLILHFWHPLSEELGLSKCTVLKAFSSMEIFQNTPRKCPRYGRCCVGGVEGGGGGTCISRYGRCIGRGA